MKFLFLYHDSDENLVFRRTRKIPLNLSLVIKITGIIEILGASRTFFDASAAFNANATYD